MVFCNVKSNSEQVENTTGGGQEGIFVFVFLGKTDALSSYYARKHTVFGSQPDLLTYSSNKSGRGLENIFPLDILLS